MPRAFVASASSCAAMPAVVAAASAAAAHTRDVLLIRASVWAHHIRMPPMARYVLRVNGQDREVDAEPGDSLLSVLRYDFGLTGSRYGCGEGQCGACTVLLDGAGARSCVTRVGSVGQKAITTIEGLAKDPVTGSK